MEKYLPIGSVCTLKKGHHKVMITGYLSVEYKGNFQMNDYVGCAYPEGLLLPNEVISFNHEEIQNVDFMGYETPEYKNLNNLLLNNAKHEKMDGN